MTDLPETKDLILEPQGSVLTIWFNRPEAKNSLSSEMVSELHAVLDVAAQDASLRTLIIRGKDGIFCAGADIKGFKSGLQDVEPNADDVARGNRFFGDLMIKLNEQPQTVIMLVEGAAIGGGLGLCCIGDVTIVTRPSATVPLVAVLIAAAFISDPNRIGTPPRVSSACWRISITTGLSRRPSLILVTDSVRMMSPSRSSNTPERCCRVSS